MNVSIGSQNFYKTLGLLFSVEMICLKSYHPKSQLFWVFSWVYSEECSDFLMKQVMLCCWMEILLLKLAIEVKLVVGHSDLLKPIKNRFRLRVILDDFHLSVFMRFVLVSKLDLFFLFLLFRCQKIILSFAFYFILLWSKFFWASQVEKLFSRVWFMLISKSWYLVWFEFTSLQVNVVCEIKSFLRRRTTFIIKFCWIGTMFEKHFNCIIMTILCRYMKCCTSVHLCRSYRIQISSMFNQKLHNGPSWFMIKHSSKHKCCKASSFIDCIYINASFECRLDSLQCKFLDQKIKVSTKRTPLLLSLKRISHHNYCKSTF